MRYSYWLSIKKAVITGVIYLAVFIIDRLLTGGSPLLALTVASILVFVRDWLKKRAGARFLG